MDHGSITEANANPDRLHRHLGISEQTGLLEASRPTEIKQKEVNVWRNVNERSNKIQVFFFMKL